MGEGKEKIKKAGGVDPVSGGGHRGTRVINFF